MIWLVEASSCWFLVSHARLWAYMGKNGTLKFKLFYKGVVMNTLPIAGIDVGRRIGNGHSFSANKVYARMKIFHDSFEKVDKAISLLKSEKDFANRPIIAMEAIMTLSQNLFRALTQVVDLLSSTPSKLIVSKFRDKESEKDKVDAKKIAILCRFKNLKLIVFQMKLLIV